ncbi:hypothetical protein BC477_13695 [Clavibacter michiganensis subsp. michiganensis]|uniref:Uncharacterized protein n=1 Tax=Clavibacter michiganensis subsp. michiganensis TaxID=33013 RepID=A0A251XIH2_CLAMM|nr:hypothetical protein BC477_13695 [Clavibacter michiganensis subsp. michiganensis]OUE02850.1 hypothetical protein CMMCAS07_12600 [Clavibacter michiganensis subsp. michiganensis]
MTTDGKPAWAGRGSPVAFAGKDEVMSTMRTRPSVASSPWDERSWPGKTVETGTVTARREPTGMHVIASSRYGSDSCREAGVKSGEPVVRALGAMRA